MIGVIILAVIFIGVAFAVGRKYERKQFVRIGKPKPNTQEVLGVFHDHKR